jgi:hypothetical protein
MSNSSKCFVSSLRVGGIRGIQEQKQKQEQRQENREGSMKSSEEIFNQQNGDVTKAYYAEMNAKGLPGQLAVALFRAQKRSTASKKYRGRRFTQDAYSVKNWSMSEVCRILGTMQAFESAPRWGWKRDPKTPGTPQAMAMGPGKLLCRSSLKPTGHCW